ncbi:hypothetical protein Tco_0419278 [Tanacetum coccineum]
MNEDYYHEQNPCYDSNSFGFDQFQPPQYTVYHQILKSQNEFFNSQNEQFKSGYKHLNTQMTTLHDLIAQAMQKKEEENRIAEEQAAKERYWKIPICDDDDDNDYTIAITPVLSTEEPVNSLKYENDILNGDIKIFLCNGIGHEFKSLVLKSLSPIQKFGRIEDDIIFNQRRYPSRKIVECHSSCAKKNKALKDNPVPSSVVVTKSAPPHFPNLFLEETNTFDNSLPESETFYFNLEEISSGSPTTHSEFILFQIISILLVITIILKRREVAVPPLTYSLILFF